MNLSRLSIFVLFLLLASYAWGQSKSDLEQQQKKLKESIAYTEKLLRQIKADSKTSASQMELIRNKINQREALIQSIENELLLIDQKISETEDIILALENDIHNLREEYAKMVIQAYRTRDKTDRLLFIFSSNDFAQAYRRMKYLQQLSEYRQHQAEAILRTQQSLERKRTALQEQRAEKSMVLEKITNEKQILGKDKEEKEKKLAELSSKESLYKKELVAAQKRAEEVRIAIKKIIEDEIKARNKAAGTTGTTYNLTPEAREMGNNFVLNKGKLPWPVEKGEITARFGEQAHPFLKGIVIKKDGITFSTTEGSKARAVFDGEVTKIMIIPGAGKIVMIRHGEFITVYTNLKETFVATGDKVKTKDEIGILMTEKGETTMEFQLWKGTVIQDPSYWIFKGR